MATQDSGPDQALSFYESLRADFDTTGPLRWHYLLANATRDQVGRLLRLLADLGFSEVEPMFDEGQEGRFLLWAAEEGTHTARSFAWRVAEVEAFAARNGLVLSDYSAGRR
jgi:hypothetical protein